MRDSIVLHFEYFDEEELTAEEIGYLVQAMMNYTRTGVEPDFTDRALRMQWKAIRARLDFDAAAYEARCEKNRQNGAKGGRPKNPQKPTETEQNPQKPKKTQRFLEKPKKADIDNDIDTDIDIKHRHGEHVLLKDKEYKKLQQDFGASETESAIQYLNEYISEKGYKSKSHYLTLRRWVFDAVKEQQSRRGKTKGWNFEERKTDLDTLEANYLRAIGGKR